jgi:hypothetical protein
MPSTVHLALVSSLIVLGCARAEPPTAEWVTLPEPTLTIGGDADPLTQFTMIWWGALLPGGEIAMTDITAQDVRIFGPDGRVSRQLGRDGEGPGEFRRLSTTLLQGDTLLIFDASVRRVTRYLTDGTLLDMEPFRPVSDLGTLTVRGRLTGGAWVVSTSHSPTFNAGPGAYRDTLRVGLMDSSLSGGVRWVATRPGMTFFVHTPTEDRSSWRVGVLPFGPRPSLLVLGDSVIIGESGTPQLDVVLAGGGNARAVTLPVDGIPDAAAVTAHRESALADSRSALDSAYAVAAHAAAEQLASRQVWESVRVWTDGTIWLGLPDARPGAPRRYLVLAPDGTPTARWLLPAGSRVLDVRDGQVLYTSRGEDDVERLALTRLPPAPSPLSPTS